MRIPSVLATVLVAAFFLSAAAMAGAQAPPNDNFADAELLPGGALGGNNIEATGETGEPNHDGTSWRPDCTSSIDPDTFCNPSVWYTGDAPTSAWFLVTTCSASTDFDTTLALYVGLAVDALTPIVSNDDMDAGCPFNAEASGVSFFAGVGTTGKTAVSGFEAETGTFELQAGFDTLAPETFIDSGPSNPSGSGSASFQFAGEHFEGSTSDFDFQCSLDSATFADCTSPAVYSGLVNGQHSFAVRASDEAGNVDASPAQYGWGVNVPSPPAPITPSPDVTFAGTSVAGRIARVVKGVARFRLTSPEDASGTITLVTAKPVAAAQRKRKLKIGSKRFNLLARRTSTVRVKLNAKGRRLLSRSKKLKVVTTVNSRDGAGNGKVTKKTVTLKTGQP